MEKSRRISLVGIIMEENRAAEKVNAVLHDYAPYIIGRMGIPYRKENIAIISVVLDAPSDVVGALAGKLGMIEGVGVKSLQSKILS